MKCVCTWYIAVWLLYGTVLVNMEWPTPLPVEEWTVGISFVKRAYWAERVCGGGGLKFVVGVCGRRVGRWTLFWCPRPSTATDTASTSIHVHPPVHLSNFQKKLSTSPAKFPKICPPFTLNADFPNLKKKCFVFLKRFLLFFPLFLCHPVPSTLLHAPIWRSSHRRSRLPLRLPDLVLSWKPSTFMRWNP